MFTGIVETTGRLRSREARGPSQRLVIEAPFEALELGESIAVQGTCLTVVAFDDRCFEVDATRETLEMTTLGRFEAGSKLNLERSLKVGARLGGHWVSGHVDGLARVSRVTAAGDAKELCFEAPTELLRFIARKGSVALDGVSLTVNGVEGNGFSVMVIPHTLAVTTLGDLALGTPTNLEIDLVARYVVRFLESGKEGQAQKDGLSVALEAMTGAKLG